MATYKKPQVITAIWTLVSTQQPLVGGADAIDIIKANGIVEHTENGATTLIPAHAVTRYAKTVLTQDVEKADAYCE